MRFIFNNYLSGAVKCERNEMYGCMKFSIPKNDLVVLHLRGGISENLFRAGFHTFFAENVAIKGDFRMYYLTDSAFKYKTIIAGYLHSVD